MDRGEYLETHAYPLYTQAASELDTSKIGGAVQFDVIIGNPPYQMTGSGGGSNDAPIYQLFVQQAMKLEPRFLCMVIHQDGWLVAGDSVIFRAEFLNDQRMRCLIDFENAKDVFSCSGYWWWNLLFPMDRTILGRVSALIIGAALLSVHINGPG